MEGAIHQHRLRFNDRPINGRVILLRPLPDYPKDADAALAALPYNSLAPSLRAMATAISGRQDQTTIA